MREKKQYMYLVIILIISGILGFLSLNRGHSWGGDFAQLIKQAESIANGTMDEFIVTNTFIMNNSSARIIGPVTYPWGLSLLLSPISLLFGRKILALKLINLIFYILFLVALFFFSRKRLKSVDALLLTCFFGFNFVMLQGLNYIHGDIPFLFFTVLCIYFIEEYKYTKIQLSKGMLIGFLIFWSCFLRGNGILLFIPLLYSQLAIFLNKEIYKDKKSTIIINIFVPVSTFFVLFVTQLIVFPRGPSILLRAYENISTNSILTNIEYYFWLPMNLIKNIPFSKTIYLILIVFYFMSMFERKTKELTAHLFVFPTLALYISYPHWQGLRYIYPILPFFVLYSFDGFKISINCLKEKHQKNVKKLVTLIMIMIIIMSLITNFQLILRNLADNKFVEGPFDKVSYEMFRYIREKTSENSVVIFFKPRVLNLLTEHNSFMTKNCGDLPGADYIVIHKFKGTYSQIDPEIITECNPNLEMNQVFENRYFLIYRIEVIENN